MTLYSKSNIFILLLKEVSIILNDLFQTDKGQIYIFQA